MARGNDPKEYHQSEDYLCAHRGFCSFWKPEGTALTMDPSSRQRNLKAFSS